MKLVERIKNINNKRSKGVSLSKRLWYILLMMLFVTVLCFGFALAFLTSRSKINFEKTQSETKIEAIKSSINAEIQNYKSLSRLIMINDEVMTLLKSNEVNSGLKNDAHYSVMEILNVCENVDSVFIIRNDGEYMSTGKGEYLLDRGLMESDKWRENIIAKRGSAIFSMNADGVLYKKKGPDFITLQRAIYDMYTQELTGILLMNISTDMLHRIMLAQGSEELCITDLQGNYISGNSELCKYFCDDFKERKITHKVVNDKVTFDTVSGCRIDNLPLVVISISSVNARNAIPFETIFVMFVLMLVFLIFTFFVTSFMDRNLAKPIVELSSAMENTGQEDNLKKPDIEVPDNEIGQLLNSYNSMIDRLNDTIGELIEKEKSQQKAEMRVLYEQIKPHFLYNSLETISYLAFEAGAENVHNALETLGSFYRNFLSKGSRTITLRREIAIIKDYLSLQRLRYGEILFDEYDVAEDTLDYYVPKLILQPLVENSIYHGIRPKGEEGIIRIKSCMKGEKLYVSVYDSGVGMDSSTIAKLLDLDSFKNNVNESGSFGLIGTIERIRQYSNDPEAVRITSEPGEYTLIEVLLPVEVEL